MPLLLSMNSRVLFSRRFCLPFLLPTCIQRLSRKTRCPIMLFTIFQPSFCPSCLFGEARAQAKLLHPSCERVKHRRFGDERKRTALFFRLHFYFLFFSKLFFRCSHASSACHARLAVRSCRFPFFLPTRFRFFLLARREPMPLHC